MQILTLLLTTMKDRNTIFKPILKLILILIGMTSSYVMANELPNACSRDQNVNEFTVLSYHEIANKSETLDSSYAVTPSDFDEQIHWLMSNGYHFVGIDDILKHRKNKKPLPNKAVLITFDDGYQSVYANAFPILKKYKIPVVIALVGSWLESKDKVDFDKHTIARSKFLSQEEIKEMVKSGLVEIASHSYTLHGGIEGNPQGSMQPAITTRKWLKDKNVYEDEKSYQQRIRNDLAKNSAFLKQYTGQKPRVMVWPYGHYNKEVRKIAEQLGMPLGLTLDDGSNTRTAPLWGMRRILVEQKMTLKDLETDMWLRNANWTDDARTTKAAHIDLDYLYDPDPVQTEKNIGILLERLNKLGVNTVYVQAFADPDANGSADYVYFPNRNLPMRADLFNRVAWQIAKCTPVKRIYAWMPMLAWQLPQNHEAVKDMVVTLQVDPTHLNMSYIRLSPFSDKSKKVIKEIYEDLAKSSHFDGILFHDDITLSDFEDDSEFARQQHKKWGLSPTVNEIRADRKQYLEWTKLKTQYLDEFAMELAQVARNQHPGLKTARNLYAQVALNKNAEEWYAQNLAQSIKYYDYTAIMTMPYMEEASDPVQFYDDIVKRVKEEQCGLERTVIELQSVNWRKNNEPLPSKEMEDTIKHLYDLGVHHVAYYPDDLFKNNPDADTMKRVFSQKPMRMHTINAK